MEAKPWYMSKTIWVNALALVSSILVAVNFAPGRVAEVSAGVLAVVNILLRYLTTDAISIKKAE